MTEQRKKLGWVADSQWACLFDVWCQLQPSRRGNVQPGFSFTMGSQVTVWASSPTFSIDCIRRVYSVYLYFMTMIILGFLFFSSIHTHTYIHNSQMKWIRRQYHHLDLELPIRLQLASRRVAWASNTMCCVLCTLYNYYCLIDAWWSRVVSSVRSTFSQDYGRLWYSVTLELPST